ncbi:hypothetical protein [Richelia sinica]|uniref:hypothetical protein n=1 Tax=Richelia sinica TaxID=1357545 RepID=UPI001686F168|nr:hypothetical protein [Richelia sinica]MBD2666205.1 hypothetical protein [Richelia sinica FACHB-800]
MTYSEQLHPWCIIRDLTNQEYIIVSRFRRRNDAVAYLQVLRQANKKIAFAIVFYAPLKTSLKPQTLN